MGKINKVLACVDFSDYSVETIDYAVKLTKNLKTEILLFNVINNRDIDAVNMVAPYFPGDFTIENHLEKMKIERSLKLKEMIENLWPNEKPRMHILVSRGIPYEAILRTTKTEGIDLVVMGNKGRSNLAGTLFGSNAEKVFRHSPVPVLIVRNRKTFGRAKSGQIDQSEVGPLNGSSRIVVGIDFSLYSTQVLEYASALAEGISAELVIVNVINKRLIESIKKAFNDEHPGRFSFEKFLKDETAKRSVNLGDMIKRHVSKEVTCRIIIKNGVPYEELLDVIDNENADLLVINAKGRTNLEEYLFGTTAEKAFRHSRSPVLSLNLRGL